MTKRTVKQKNSRNYVNIMSFLNTSGNVGPNALAQLSDSSCATQYKMAVEGSATLTDEQLQLYLQDSKPAERLTSIQDTSLPNVKYFNDDIYTFQNANQQVQRQNLGENDIIIKNDGCGNTLSRSISANTGGQLLKMPNGAIKNVTSVANGIHYPSTSLKTHTKATQGQKPVAWQTEQTKDLIMPYSSADLLTTTKLLNEVCGPMVPLSSKSSIISVSHNSSVSVSNAKHSVTFASSNSDSSDKRLQVNKKKQVDLSGEVREEPFGCGKGTITVTPRKLQTVGKPPPAAVRGRGPTLHEARQRATWHAPGAVPSGPLLARPPLHLDSSGDEDECMPTYGLSLLPSDMEGGGVSTRGVRLAARRAALRRAAVLASSSARLLHTHVTAKQLADTVEKQISNHHTGSSISKLSSQSLSLLLATRGLTEVMTSQERRKLRCGTASQLVARRRCTERRCDGLALPCAAHCLRHVTRCAAQRLFAPCAAVFARGTRCTAPVLPLLRADGGTPLCAEHAWKRDNYNKLSQERVPRPVARKRTRVTATPRAHKRSKRRRPRTTVGRAGNVSPGDTSRATIYEQQEDEASELNVCSDSSACDSSEDTGIGGLSESEFIAVSDHTQSCDVGVEQVLSPPAHDDLLDSAVLNQIPDEAFTEFFNQETNESYAGSGAEELERALACVGRSPHGLLDALLDERALADTLATLPDLPPHSRTKLPVSTPLTMEMSNSAPS